MPENLFTVSKKLSTKGNQMEPAEFLLRLRQLVQEVKKTQPEMSESQLYDVGFVHKDDELVVNMYFQK